MNENKNNLSYGLTFTQDYDETKLIEDYGPSHEQNLSETLDITFTSKEERDLFIQKELIREGIRNVLTWESKAESLKVQDKFNFDVVQIKDKNFKEHYVLHDLWSLPDITGVIQNDQNVYLKEPKAIIIQKNKIIFSHLDYSFLFVGTQRDCENALSAINEADKKNQSVTIYHVEDADNSLINYTNNSNGERCFLSTYEAAEFAKKVKDPWIRIYPHNNIGSYTFLKDDEALEFIKSANLKNTVSLLEDLHSNEFMKSAAQGSLDDSNDFLSNVNFFTKIFKKGDIQEWQANKVNCEKDILEYDNKISQINKNLKTLDYSSSELKNISSVIISKDENLHYMIENNPWAKLLNESQQLELAMEVVSEKKGKYSSLINFKDYINSFNTDSEKLDFIKGFMYGKRAINKQTNSYKIGLIFDQLKKDFDIDASKLLSDYAPQYRHDVTLVELVSNLAEKEPKLHMLESNYDEPLLAGASFDELNELTSKEHDILGEEYEKTQNEISSQISELKDEIKSIKNKIDGYKFYGKIDFLGKNRQGETIIGETLYYDNYKDYKKEIDESFNCGRPISYTEITEPEYQEVLKENEISEKVENMTRGEKEAFIQGIDDALYTYHEEVAPFDYAVYERLIEEDEHKQYIQEQRKELKEIETQATKGKRVPKIESDLKLHSPEILINGKSKYTVLKSAGANRLLKRLSDGEILIAQGFNGENWLSGKYYGKDGLSKAVKEWSNNYSKTGSYGYDVKTIIQTTTTKAKSIHR